MTKTPGSICLKTLAIYLLAFLITDIGGINVSAGPLKVHLTNPRYFADDSGKAIYLGGHQIFNGYGSLRYDFRVIKEGNHTLWAKRCGQMRRQILYTFA